MKKQNKNFRTKFVFLFAFLLFGVSAAFAQTQIKLSVDATEAARNVLRVRETMAVKAGALTLFYPKWIPGEHAPTGTLNDMVNLFVTANGKLIVWRRDDVEMFAFHLTIPANVKQIEIGFDDVSQPGTLASAHLSRVKWNRLLLYPKGAKSDDVQISGSLKLPAGWDYATALPVEKEQRTTINPVDKLSKLTVDFKPVSLTTFVDSPAVVGEYYKRVALENGGGAAHEMDIFADTPEALAYKPEALAGWNNLVKETTSMFGARHYDKYKFLVTLSDVGGGEGLEHHESSEDGVGLNALSNELELLDFGDLLGHEFAHSWNGKYRRPAGLTTPDFEQPMRGELLWVYEGLTQYLGKVLPTRAGLWTPDVFRDVMAETAATMDTQTGRRWRPLVDTARAVQFTYDSPRAWRNERRRVDYYFEGALIWMEADVLIRQRSKNKLSLDDFFKRFHGGQNTGARVLTYDFEEIVRTLNQVSPYDWRAFFNERVYAVAKRAPLGGITNGGWRLVYNDQPNAQIMIDEYTRKFTNAMFSIGVLLGEDGTISDINPDFAAAKAGLAPGMKITRINGADFSAENFHKAIADAKRTSLMEIVAENGNATETYKLNYKGGERYPHLERDAAKPDLLSEIIKSH